MRTRLNRRPTPALVIAIVALVLAVGGTSFAAAPVTFIAKAVGLNTRQKKRVTAIADAQIAAKASTLSVLNATNATNATNAVNAANALNANTVGHATVTTIFKSIPSATPLTQFFSGNGLTLWLECEVFGVIGIQYQSADANAELNWNGDVGGFSNLNYVSVWGGKAVPATGTGAYDLFNPGQPVDYHREEGSIVLTYAQPSGHTATMNLGFDNTAAFGSEQLGCAVWGTAIASN